MHLDCRQRDNLVDSCCRRDNLFSFTRGLHSIMQCRRTKVDSKCASRRVDRYRRLLLKVLVGDTVRWNPIHRIDYAVGKQLSSPSVEQHAPTSTSTTQLGKQGRRYGKRHILPHIMRLSSHDGICDYEKTAEKRTCELTVNGGCVSLKHLDIAYSIV